AIVGDRDVLARNEKAGRHHVVDRDALIAEMLLEREALGRRIAEPEFHLRGWIEPAVGEIAARLGAGAAGERRLEKLRRHLHYVGGRAAFSLARLLFVRDLGQGQAGFGGEPLDRLRKREAFGEHHEVEDRAVLAGGEVEPRLLLVVDKERRRLLLVERREPL